MQAQHKTNRAEAVKILVFSFLGLIFIIETLKKKPMNSRNLSVSLTIIT